VNCVSIVEYRSLVKRLNEAHSANWPPAKLAVWTAALMALCGMVMALHLISLA
jgi:hypothetical protein